MTTQESQQNLNSMLVHRDPRVQQLLDMTLEPAITVSQLVSLGHEVTDAIVLYATPAASKLFGFQHASGLIGQFASKIHHPDDIMIARQYALARLHNEWFPNPYLIRILQYPSQEPIPVVKYVWQLEINDTLIWIAFISPLCEPRLSFRMPVTQAMLDRANKEPDQSTFGKIHVAYMDHLIQSNGNKLVQSLEDIVRGSPHYILYRNSKCISDDSKPITPNITNLIHKIKFMVRGQHDQRRPHFMCLKCAWPWYGTPGAKRPRKCPQCSNKEWDRPYLYKTKAMVEATVSPI